MKGPSEDKLRKLLQSKYEGLDPVIPSDAWENISSSMDKSKVKRRRRIKWAIALIVLLTTSYFLISGIQQFTKRNEVISSAQNQANTERESDTEIEQSKDPLNKSSDNQDASSKNSGVAEAMDSILVKSGKEDLVFSDEVSENSQVSRPKTVVTTRDSLIKASEIEKPDISNSQVSDRVEPSAALSLDASTLDSIRTSDLSSKEATSIESLKLQELNNLVIPKDSIGSLSTHWTYGRGDSLLKEKMLIIGFQGSGNINYITPIQSDQVLIGPDDNASKKIISTINTSLYSRFSAPLFRRVHLTSSFGIALMRNQINYEEFDLSLIEPSLFGLTAQQLRNTTFYDNKVEQKTESGNFASMGLSLGLEYQILKRSPIYFADINVGRSMLFSRKEDEISGMYDRQYSTWTFGFSANYRFMKTNRIKLRLFSSGTFKHFDASDKFLFKPQQIGLDFGFIPNWFRKE